MKHGVTQKPQPGIGGKLNSGYKSGPSEVRLLAWRRYLAPAWGDRHYKRVPPVHVV